MLRMLACRASKDVSLLCLCRASKNVTLLCLSQGLYGTDLVKMLRPRLVALGYFQQLTINLLIKSSVTEV